MTIEKFLKYKPDEYDFSNENASEYYCNIENGVDKFFAYMLASRKKSFKNNEIAQKSLEKNGYILTDPDNNSILMQQIYKILWNVEDNSMKKCIIKESVKGDTLNSANTTIGKLYKYLEKEARGNIKKHKAYIYFIICDYLSSENTEIIDEIINCKELEKYVKSYHTIGNFMPVPVNCNGPRGCSKKVWDYLDLTLLYIYNYYINGDEKGIRYIVNELKNENWKETEKAKRYIRWLNDYGKKKEGWKNFITSNYLEAYINEDYYPNELWKGHFDTNSKGEIKSVLPTSKSKCIEFLDNASDCIIQRGNQMVKVLINKLNEKG